MSQPTTEHSPQRDARLAGAFYLGTIITGAMAAVSPTVRQVANLGATLCYVVVILLFYRIFLAVSRSLSLLATVVGLCGCLVGALGWFDLDLHISPLVVFGVYCLLIGVLILRSMFLPRFLGVLMVFAGVGWLTFVAPALARRLSPFNMAPGVLGEGVLTGWLLAKGLDVAKWTQQAASADNRRG